MNKKKKNILIAVAVIVGVFAAIFAILMIKRGSTPKTVNVYPVNALQQDVFEDNTSSSSGDVRCEGFQNFMISDTQKVEKVLVKEGQAVKAGDTILAYDTTLSDLDLEKADIEVQKLDLELTNAQNELYEINCMTPHYEVLISPKNKYKYKPVETPYFMSGKGTKEKPMYWIIDRKNTFNEEFFSQILPKGQNDVYVVLIQREHNAVNGEILNAFGLYVKFAGSGMVIKPFVPEIPSKIEKADIPEEPYYEEYGSDYTEAEIAEMRAEKEAEIKDLEVQLRVATLEYEKLQKEYSGTNAIAKEDGIVRTVRDPEEAYKNDLPVVQISSGGGYYIEAFMNELELEKMSPGDTVHVETYNSGVSCDGEITKISMFPAQNADAWSNGNTNVSYYPFTVFVPDDAGLEEGEYANVTFNAVDENDTSFYLDNMFIRKDGGEAYVYAAGEDGKLVKKPIQTGKSLWGSFTQIKDGLSTEDKIAFPYGKNVKEGAEIVEAALDELYSY